MSSSRGESTPVSGSRCSLNEGELSDAYNVPLIHRIGGVSVLDDGCRRVLFTDARIRLLPDDAMVVLTVSRIMVRPSTWESVHAYGWLSSANDESMAQAATGVYAVSSYGVTR